MLSAAITSVLVPQKCILNFQPFPDRKCCVLQRMSMAFEMCHIQAYVRVKSSLFSVVRSATSSLIWISSMSRSYFLSNFWAMRRAVSISPSTSVPLARLSKA